MSRMNGYYEENNGYYDCSTQREYRNYNGCNCCQSTIICEPKAAVACCGIAGICEVFLVLQESIARVNTPGFGVNVHIVTVTGQEYDVLFGTGVAITPIIKDGVLTYGTLVISLCDIAKLDLEIGGINNPAFIGLLDEKIKEITTKCRKVYGHEDIERDCDEDYNYGNHQGCTKCTQGLQDAINDGTPISQLSYNGSQQVVNAIPTLDSVVTATVIGSIAVSNTTGSFLTGASLATTGQSVVGNVATLAQGVITSITTTTAPVVTGITTGTAAVSGPITVVPTTVVNGVTLNPVALVSNVNGNASSVIGSVTGVTTTALANVTTTTIPFVTGVTASTTSVLASVVSNTTAFVTGITPTTTPVVISVTPNTTVMVTSISQTTAGVVTGITQTSTGVVTNYPNPTSVNGVISGVNAINVITPILETVATFTSAGTGVLQVIIPANVFGNGIPPAAVPINVVANGATISFNGNTTFYALPTATPVLGGASTAALSNNVLTGLGTPTTVPALTGVTPATIPVVASVTPVTIGAVIGITTATTGVVTGITPATTGALVGITQIPATVLNGVTLGTQPAVIGVTSSPVNVVGSITAPTVSVISSIIQSTTPGNLVTAVSTQSINAVAAPTVVAAVTGVTPTTSTVNSLTGSTTGTVNSVQSVTAVTVVAAATLNTSAANALASVQVIGAGQSVVQDITTKAVQTLSPAPETINGSLASAGNGIVVINDTNGDISIYSECEITTING